MKMLFSLSRFFFILSIWTIGYAVWLQRLMVRMWGFNPINKVHWIYIWNEWQNGWVIQTAREWLFVIILFLMVPLWLTGLTILCTIPWLKWFKVILLFPIKLIRQIIRDRQKGKNTARPKVTKKKSYKQTRPPAIRAGSGKIKAADKDAEAEKETVQVQEEAPAPKVERARTENTPAVQRASSSSSSSGGSVMDILRSAGYRLISDVKIAGKKIDFVGVASNHILLCLIDSESGDWLADEERFNDEEPLWFSESNHRISPVRVVLNAYETLKAKIAGESLNVEVRPMVVIRQGTIINAEDMFEVWKGLNATVCRHDDGGPDEISALSSVISSVSAPDDKLYHSVAGIVS